MCLAAVIPSKKPKKIFNATLVSIIVAILSTLYILFISISSPAAPKFIQELQHTVVEEGSTAKFFTEVTSLTSEVLWKKDGKLIQGTKRFIIKNNGLKHSLSILNTVVKDSGTYTCVLGGKTSSATLYVKAAPRFIQELRHTEVEEGGTAEFYTEITALTSEVLWKKDGKIIQGTERFIMKNNGLTHRLSISNTIVADSGTYTCVLGKISSSAKLYVIEPEFIQELQHTVVEEGGTAEFFTRVTAITSKVLWKKDKKLIQGTERFIIKSNGFHHSLSILNTLVEDSGTYACVLGRKTSSATLKVEESSKFYLKKSTIGLGIKVVAGAAAAVGVAAAALPLAGFTATGVAASSMAAAAQSYIGCVSAGSAFAALQSAGAAGMAFTTKAIIAGGGAAIAALANIKNNSTGN